MGQIMQGTVEVYNEKEGFGFFKSPQCRDQIFFHRNNCCEVEGAPAGFFLTTRRTAKKTFLNPRKGESVILELGHGRMGPEAIHWGAKPNGCKIAN